MPGLQFTVPLFASVTVKVLPPPWEVSAVDVVLNRPAYPVGSYGQPAGGGWNAGFVTPALIPEQIPSLSHPNMNGRGSASLVTVALVSVWTPITVCSTPSKGG